MHQQHGAATTLTKGCIPPLTLTEYLTTVMSTIITAVNTNLHPASNGNITPIILSYDRDNTELEGSDERASYFLAAYYKETVWGLTMNKSFQYGFGGRGN